MKILIIQPSLHKYRVDLFNQLKKKIMRFLFYILKIKNILMEPILKKNFLLKF